MCRGFAIETNGKAELLLAVFVMSISFSFAMETCKHDSIDLLIVAIMTAIMVMILSLIAAKMPKIKV